MQSHGGIFENLDLSPAGGFDGGGGLTDTMGCMHGNAQFAGSSSVSAHVEMIGFLGAGNTPMVGMTVIVAVAVEESLKK